MSELDITIVESPALEVEIIEEPVREVRVNIVGSGPPGPPGPQGPSGDLNDSYEQTSASATWGPIEHNLGKYPSVQAIDSAGSELNPGVVHNSLNFVTLTFTAATSGTAFFN